MKKIILFWVLSGIASAAMGKVLSRICEADGNTPFDGRDIMVGTRLTIIVSSDANEQWDGGLYITDPYRDYGVLYGRDYNDATMDWEGSRFAAAGEEARIYDWQDDFMSGFDMYGDENAIKGDWYIIDYNAIDIGDCNVGFYDYSVSYFDPIYCHDFNHVRTRDFDNDTIVNFIDYSIFAFYWGDTDCVDPNWCEGADLDTNGSVDDNDLELFTYYWLERTR
jgi:hypothetical protein